MDAGMLHIDMNKVETAEGIDTHKNVLHIIPPGGLLDLNADVVKGIQIKLLERMKSCREAIEAIEPTETVEKTKNKKN